MNRSQAFDSNATHRPTVPFAELVEPFNAVGEVVYQIGVAGISAIAAIAAAVNRGIVYRRTAAALSRLDDHMLRDIGVTRAEITHVARSLADG